MPTFTHRRQPTIGGAAIAGLCLATAASAQTTPVATPSTSDGADISVIGSRLPDADADTGPIVSFDSRDLRDAAPNNIADALATLPGLLDSPRTSSPITAAAAGINGQNLLSLRNLGANRTLVLLDGLRLPASNAQGSVDINMLPQALVKRVDTIAGGASAVRGSDAIGGIIDFALDTHFTGLKGAVRSGLSSRGDLPSVGGSVVYGDDLLSGRLHIVASAELFHEAGLAADADTHRAWFERAAGQYPVPGAATTVTVVPDIRSSVGAYGGMVDAGPLKGTTFLPGGALGTFDYGSQTGTAFQSGGSGPRVNIGLAPSQTRGNAFVRGELTLSPQATIFGSLLYARSDTRLGAFVPSQTGPNNQFTIFRDNAFLPQALAERMDALGLQSVTIGRYDDDFPLVDIRSRATMLWGAAGGHLAFGRAWRLDTAVTWGRSQQDLAEDNLTINRRLYAAADAVGDPTSGAIACRSTLAGLDPGCVPLDIFGSGAPSAGAIDWVTGNSIKRLVLQQFVAGANLTGDFGDKFSFGAGPITTALGVEFRREGAAQTTDPISQMTTSTAGLRGAPAAQGGRVGGFAFFNPLPLAGHYDVAEANAELGVPMVRDSAIGRSLNVALAGRASDYSRSDTVFSWRVGATYQPVTGVALRYTRSRDIRGPNTQELFSAAIQSSNHQLYAGEIVQNLTIISGNPALRPEVGDTEDYGIVIAPTGRGMRLSVDRYATRIHQAIGTLSAQQTIDQCLAGTKALCANVTIAGPGSLVTRTPSLNLGTQFVSGIDIQGQVDRRIGGRQVMLRLLATRRLADYLQVPGATRIDTLGEPESPKWSALAQSRIAGDRNALFVQLRYIGTAVFDASKTAGIDTDRNCVRAVAYLDATISRRIGPASIDLSVTNLLDRAPPVAPRNPTTFSSPTNAVYDPIGRYVSIGVRTAF
ncbi:TonB-dependent receptor [Sphingomonas koreensis]|nr:TonB-dependent receptor [Sphingomonas koreensis]